jgi:hypothetical protein
MFDESTPYTVLVEDNDLKSEPQYFEQHWKGRELKLRKIQELIGLNDRRILTCHGHQVFSAKVLSDLKNEFLIPRGWSYEQMLDESPYEFTWYNMWLQKTRVIPVEIREPLVKVFHNEGQHLDMAMRGTSVGDLARSYVAIVINSNFSRSWGDVLIDEPRAETLARYLSYSEIASALKTKIAASMTRRLKPNQ